MKKRRDDIHETPDVTYIHNPEVAHEVSDVNIKAILQFTAGLLVFAVTVHILMWLMLRTFEAREVRREEKAPPSPMALTPKERLPPEPRLQAAPGFGDDLALEGGRNLELQAPQAEYRVLRQRWEQVLRNGQKDEKTGAVTALPIEQAIKQVAAQGLPARPAAAGQKSYQQVMEIPSYPSSGRMMEMRRQ
ncbi:MAG: hypothetical protein JO360_10680 [Acidobacteria bacterium]|nr:hypothetical protein [Acidobacteriota bacterium]